MMTKNFLRCVCGQNVNKRRKSHLIKTTEKTMPSRQNQKCICSDVGTNLTRWWKIKTSNMNEWNKERGVF